MLLENRNIAAQVLCEAAANITNGDTDLLIDDIDSNETETINESSDVVGVVALLAAYIAMIAAVPVISAIQNQKFRKKAARNSKAVTREDIHDGYEYLTKMENKIKEIFKTTKYKKFIDGEVVKIYNNFVDASTQFDKKTEHRAFTIGYTIFGINLVKLAKMEKKYDEIITSNDRLSDFIKNETKSIAKVCDAVREVINKNKFLKDNFQCYLVFNEGKTCVYCVLNAKHSMVLNTSKYLKTDKK